MTARSSPRARIGLATALLLPSLAATAAVTAFLFLVADGGGASAALRAAEAERDAVRAVASALAEFPAERRPAALEELSRGFPGRLLLVGPGREPAAVDTPGGPVRPPWRVPPEGLAEVRGAGDASVLVVGVPLSGGGAGAGVVAVLAPRHVDRAWRTSWFAAAFAAMALGLSMLPVVVVGQRFSADLRRVAAGLSRMVDVEAEAAGAGKPPPRPVTEAAAQP